MAHFHYVLFAGTAMGVFGGIYFWFPKMFGRMMNEFVGKWHFLLTFIFFNGTFFPMHFLGVVGIPRRLADPYHYATFHHLQPLNAFMTYCAIGMVSSQVIFAANFFSACSLAPRPGAIPGTPMAGMEGPQPAGTRQFRLSTGRLSRTL